jgi:hypothetical protein
MGSADLARHSGMREAQTRNLEIPGSRHPDRLLPTWTNDIAELG